MRGIQAFFPPAWKAQAVSDNPSRLLLERWLDRKKRSFDLILTEDILDEYKGVLNRLRVRAAPYRQPYRIVASWRCAGPTLVLRRGLP